MASAAVREGTRRNVLRILISKVADAMMSELHDPRRVQYENASRRLRVENVENRFLLHRIFHSYNVLSSNILPDMTRSNHSNETLIRAR